MTPIEPMRTRRWGSRIGRLALLALALVLVAGCLDEPEIEDRWTLLEMQGATLSSLQPVSPGPIDSIRVNTTITYRSIITGFAVAELRASSSISSADVFLAPDAARERMAYDIDRILANSVSVGRATRAITGWDHLIQPIDFTFNAVVPGADSTGAPPGLFLVFYLGAGDEIERPDGTDTLIVTPFLSSDYEILPVGVELNVTP